MTMPCQLAREIQFCIEGWFPNFRRYPNNSEVGLDRRRCFAHSGFFISLIFQRFFGLLDDSGVARFLR
jgi:hypothetical protein